MSNLFSLQRVVLALVFLATLIFVNGIILIKAFKAMNKKIPKCVSIWAGGKVYLYYPDLSGFLFFKVLQFVNLYC